MDIQIELATVQESVSNPIIGNMRMQFWRDALKGIADVCIPCRPCGSSGYLTVVSAQGRPPKHPIALALSEASRKASLPTYHLKRIVDARVRSSITLSQCQRLTPH